MVDARGYSCKFAYLLRHALRGIVRKQEKGYPILIVRCAGIHEKVELPIDVVLADVTILLPQFREERIQELGGLQRTEPPRQGAQLRAQRLIPLHGILHCYDVCMAAHAQGLR